VSRFINKDVWYGSRFQLFIDVIINIIHFYQFLANNLNRKLKFSVTYVMSYNENIYLNGPRGIEIPCICDYCEKEFFRTRDYICNIRFKKQILTYCGKACCDKGRKPRKIKTYNCKNCGKETKRTPGMIKKSKNIFCCSSCSTIYLNKNKKYGYRRSKLEVWLEKQISLLYPFLEIVCNSKKIIESELDFFFPSLNLAVELNGPFHYEPIFGEETLQKIVNNDNRKFAACREKGLSLCVIDSSSMKYFKESNCIKYLDIFKKLIDEHIKALNISN
jgi:hypothetical protein